MKNLTMMLVLLALSAPAIMLGGQSVACPYDGWPAWATGLRRGNSCEYGHWQQGEQHRFWTYCQ